jgi:hypothetical protein
MLFIGMCGAKVQRPVIRISLLGLLRQQYRNSVLDPEAFVAVGAA